MARGPVWRIPARPQGAATEIHHLMAVALQARKGSALEIETHWKKHSRSLAISGFTEGLTLPDLSEARALLADLGTMPASDLSRSSTLFQGVA